MNGGITFSCIAVMTALGFGFSAGRYDWFGSEKRNGAEKSSEQVAVVTLLSRDPEATTTTRVSTSDSLEGLSFEACRPQLQKLLQDLGRSAGTYGFTSPLENARLLQTIEAILEKGTFEEVASVLEIPSAGNSFGAPESVFRRLAEISPKRAGAVWSDFFNDKNVAEIGLSGLLEPWAKTDFGSADRWVSGLEAGEQKAMARAILFGFLAEEDPQRALHRLDEIETPVGRSRVMGIIAENLSKEQLGKLADAMLVDSSGEENDGALRGLLTGWGRQDGDGMAVWLFEQDLEALEEQTLTHAFSSQIARGPQQFLEQFGPRLKAHAKLQGVATHAWWSWLGSRQGGAEAISWLGQNEEIASKLFDSHSSYSVMKNEQMTGRHAENFLEQLAQLPQSTSFQSFEKRFLKQLTESFPLAVLNYSLEQLPIGLESNHTIAYATAQWARNGEPGEVVQWTIENLTRDRGRSDSLRFALGIWAEREPGEAVAFLMGLPDADRGSSISDVAGAWVDKDPDGFMEYLRSDIDPETHSYFTNSGFFKLAQNPGSAAEALPEVLQLPPGKLRHNGVRGLFGGWAYVEQAAAREAIAELPEGSLRNTAILGFNSMAARKDPGMAVEMAIQISVPQARERELVNRGKAWMRADEAAARKMISMNPKISAAIKKRILEEGGGN